MIRAILTDIEGTTSSISFVHDVLFSYARQRMAEYVRSHAHEPPVAACLQAVRDEAGQELDVEQIIAQLLQWIDEDKKITPLKALQGMIWAAGYEQGDFTGHMYEDAVQCLRQWHQQGIALYVFSSGSVKAQKLLFGFSDYGDLTPLFSGYYDTTIGNKREAAAYRAIADNIGLPAGEILFLSDISEELHAAQAAGMQVIHLVRDGDPDPASDYPQVSDFSQIAF
jgi:enolase-phosphatase E1